MIIVTLRYVKTTIDFPFHVTFRQQQHVFPVVVSDWQTVWYYIIVQIYWYDIIDISGQFSSSRRILEEVKLFCPDIKIEVAYW